MNAGIESKKRRLIFVLLVALLAPRTSVSGQTIQFFPIRSAPLGSPVGTVGDPVTPTFNVALDCWELKVPGSVEVDIDVQAFGWGNAAGAPALGAIQATVNPAGYDNGVGGALNPKGWPDSPGDGAYQARSVCHLNGDPCVVPFSRDCNGGANGFCIHNRNWVFPPACNDLPAIATLTLDYAWATVAQVVGCVLDTGEVKTIGGLILEVPLNAAGTYVIDFNTGAAFTFMGCDCGTPIPGVVKTSACITIIEGACCVDTDSDGILNSCQENVFQGDCVTSGGLFQGEESSCSGLVGACCLDGDGDEFDETCVVTDRDCCDAQGGSFLGADATCGNDEGACFLDFNGDGFDDTCRVMNTTCCDAQNGTLREAGSSCAGVGACCLDTDDNQFFEDLCVEIDRIGCDAAGGLFFGAPSACLGDQDNNGIDDLCDSEIPAVSEWGLIVLALLLLVGIKICFARRRPSFRVRQEA